MFRTISRNSIPINSRYIITRFTKTHPVKYQLENNKDFSEKILIDNISDNIKLENNIEFLTKSFDEIKSDNNKLKDTLINIEKQLKMQTDAKNAENAENAKNAKKENDFAFRTMIVSLMACGLFVFMGLRKL